jgi:Fe-S cluster assembly protein SufD
MASALLESLLEPEAAETAASEPDWLSATRRSAAVSVERDGLPGPRSEAWKYTSLRALEQRRYANGDADASTRTIDPARFNLPGIDGARLVFVNGLFRSDLSSKTPIDGLTISTLGSANAGELDASRRLLECDFVDPSSAFARLNTVLAADGPIVRVRAGAAIAQPIHFVFVGASADSEIAWNLRAVIEIGAGASLQLIEHHVGSGGAGASQLGNIVSQYAIGRTARLDLVQIQDAAESTSLIRRSEFTLADDAVLSTHTLETGAQMMRHDFIVDLAEPGARFTSRGVFALRGRQHADTHLDVQHSARDATSDIVWRGVADQRSRGVFHGAITVAAGADGADAKLSNKNLLLSANAEIDTQPVLEIHADEVKAAHGATVGQLDEDALFYLRSRGLAPDAARRLLISAFCSAVLNDLPERPLREHLDALLAARLPQATEDLTP